MVPNDPVDSVPAIDERVPDGPRTWREMAQEAALFLPNLAKLFTRLMRDPRVPLRRKALVGAVLVYVVSPVDLVPDFVVGLGHIDDIVLVSVALDHLMSGTSAAVVREHWDGSEDALDLVRSVFAWGAEIVPSMLTRFLPR